MSGVTKAQLRNVITEIDGVSQSEFGAIAALARPDQLHFLQSHITSNTGASA